MLRLRSTEWRVQEHVGGQWHDLGEPTTRFAEAVKVYDAAPGRRLLRNGKPLPAQPNDPHPTLFEE